MARKKVVKKKIEIVFDPEKRKDFLTGFRKRKNERKKRAKEELERSIKKERNSIRQEIKDGIKHMKKSFEPLKELTEKDKANEDEYEDDDVKVKIVELSTSELAERNNFIGENRGAAASDDDESESDAEQSTTEDPNRIPGMDLGGKANKRKLNFKRAGDKESSALKDRNTLLEESENIKSKKELDRLKKNKTLKKLKNSKVFKAKERVDKKANQKKTKRDKNNTLKSLPKNQRKKKKYEPSRYNKGRMITRKEMRKKQGN